MLSGASDLGDAGNAAGTSACFDCCLHLGTSVGKHCAGTAGVLYGTHLPMERSERGICCRAGRVTEFVAPEPCCGVDAVASRCAFGGDLSRSRCSGSGARRSVGGIESEHDRAFAPGNLVPTGLGASEVLDYVIDAFLHRCVCRTCCPGALRGKKQDQGQGERGGKARCSSHVVVTFL